MLELFQKLPNTYQGITLIISGIILLIHTLGIIETGLNLIIIAAALYLIACGLIKIGAYNRILLLLKRHRPPKEK